MRITSLGKGVMGIETVATKWFGKDGKELRRLVSETFQVGKDPACDLIQMLAREWAERVGWAP